MVLLSVLIFVTGQGSTCSGPSKNLTPTPSSFAKQTIAPTPASEARMRAFTYNSFAQAFSRERSVARAESIAISLRPYLTDFLTNQATITLDDTKRVDVRKSMVFLGEAWLRDYVNSLPSSALEAALRNTPAVELATAQQLGEQVAGVFSAGLVTLFALDQGHVSVELAELSSGNTYGVETLVELRDLAFEESQLWDRNDEATLRVKLQTQLQRINVVLESIGQPQKADLEPSRGTGSLSKLIDEATSKQTLEARQLGENLAKWLVYV